jgi:hypothetical protein
MCLLSARTGGSATGGGRWRALNFPNEQNGTQPIPPAVIKEVEQWDTHDE